LNQSFPMLSADRVSLPGFEVDLAREELRTSEGAHVELRPRSFAVLRLLAVNLGRLVTKDEIMDKVWDDAVVTEDSLTQCIADIRRALGDERRQIVRTVPRRGYLLLGQPMSIAVDGSAHPIEAEAPAPASVEHDDQGSRSPRGWLANRSKVAVAATAMVAAILVAGFVFRPFNLQPGKELLGRAPDRPSLAVLAFRPAIANERNDLLAAGVANELINELARNKDLRVLARDSSFALSRQNHTPREIGERLRVRYLVDGTVNRVDETLTIDIQLIDTRDGTVAWAEHYAANAQLIAEVQPAIVARIAVILHSGLREIEKQAILGRSPRDLDVYELTLRGLALKHEFSEAATRAGRAALDEAIRRDPAYAPALLNYAWLNVIDILNQFTGEWHLSQLDEVIAQFNRAIELDPNLPNAYQGLSRALTMKGDLDQALRMIRRALELGPSDADNIINLGGVLYQKGEVAEALRAVEEALDLNPMRPSYYARYYGEVLWGARRFDKALEQNEECLRKAPRYTVCEIFRILTLVALNRQDEAVNGYRQAVTRFHNFEKVVRAFVPRDAELAARYRHDMQSVGWRMPN
jgi:TolB-like protein/DNA-binding winged helix-turn-helix (wHTH) protein/cytochrome c-type biogenesis protein CcmH/NrfG